VLDHVEIANFKSIKHLDMQVNPFMVFVGPNGAGKTNIVQALDLLGAVLEQGSIEPVREFGYDELIRREKRPARGGLVLGAGFSAPSSGMVRNRPTRPSSSRTPAPAVRVAVKLTVRGSVNEDDLQLASEEISLRREDGSVNIKITRSQTVVNVSGDDGFIAFLMRILPFGPAEPKNAAQAQKHLLSVLSNFNGIHAGGLLLFSWAGFGWSELAPDCRVHRLRLDSSSLRRDAVTSERYKGVIGPAGEGLALAVERLRGHGPKPSSGFNELLQRLKDVFPRIEDIIPFRLQPGRLVLLFKERGIDERLGQSNVSDGLLHSLALLLALEPKTRPRGVLAIEEPENAIHPWPLRQMLGRAQATAIRGPLVITTHSPTVVDAVREPSSLYVVEQYGERGTTVTPAITKEKALDSILKESGKKLGEIWLEGGLGGVPTTE
jgi:predicted ATPase